MVYFPKLTMFFFILGRWLKKNFREAGHRWLTPVILATQEIEIRRIVV
jgi:hypothetical protein